MAAEPVPVEVPAEDKKKPSRGKKLLSMVLVIAAMGAFAGGVFAGPKIGARLHMPGYQPPPAVPAAERKAVGTMTLDPIIVDLRDKDDIVHHLKVGIAVEMLEPPPDEKNDQLTPRMRDAAIGILRGLEYDKVTKPSEYEGIRKRITERIKGAIGEDKVSNILFTDFVIQ